MFLNCVMIIMIIIIIMGTCAHNLKSVLELLTLPVRCGQTHRVTDTETDRQTANDNSISAIHSVHLAELINNWL